MDLDAVMLARIQFAFTIAFHIIFPAFTIGLSAWIATLLIMWVRTDNERYRLLARFWTKIFAVSFAMGVVSGIVLSYQFGTNWSQFFLVVGNVIGPLIGYEVLTAFFLEATFLGVLLFGWDRVPRWLHLTAALCVAVGTLMSAFWILSANSWMHSPAGHYMVDGIAYPEDWWAIVFNPTFPYRLTHMVIAAYLTTSFVVIAVGARYLLAGIHREQALTMLRMGLGMAIILAPTQAVVGDFHGLKTLEYQPAKIAAIEGHWETKAGTAAARRVRHSQRGAGAQPLFHRDPVSRQPDPHPYARGDLSGARRVRRRGPPAGAAAVLRLPAHGGHRGDLHRAGRLGLLAVVARAAGALAVVPQGCRGIVAAGLHRHPRRLDGDGGRPPALGRQRDIAHRGCGLAGVGRIGGDVAGAVRRHLSIVFSAGIYYINRLIVRGPQPPSTGRPTGVPNRPLTGASREGPDPLAETG
jgi:cytochrome bd ubiquinol oxidase subunit I